MNKETKKYANPSSTKKNKKTNKIQKDTIDLDNEIIIGLTTKKASNKVKKSKNKSQKQTNVKKQGDKKKLIKQKKKLSQKEIIRVKILKWTSLAILLIIAIMLFLLSDVFNVKEIAIENNNKISKERIIQLSEITNQDNMFKISKKSITEKIMKEPYIEKVKIKRKLNGMYIIIVEERETTYLLEFANAYVYIDNQGYVLEISDNKIEKPILTGIQTQSEDIKVGQRLINSDLEKLQTVIKIMSEAKNNQIANLITKIDISNNRKFLIYLETEQKIVHFGDSININEKILWMKKIVETEKGKAGEIFIEETKGRTYFKEKV